MKNRSLFSRVPGYAFLSLVILSLITVGLWVVSVSEETIKRAIKGAVSGSSFELEIKGFRKGLFYSLDAERVLVLYEGKELIGIDDVSVRINPLYLFLVRHRSSFEGRIHNGSITGKLDISRKRTSADIRIKDADVGDMVYLRSIGLKGKGILGSDIYFDANKADVKFYISGAQFETFVFGGVPVPLEMFNEAKGMLEIKGNETEIKSLSLEGKGIYGRIRGKIKDNFADLSIEIMPDASAMNRFPAMAFLERYNVSPGYYVIPVKTKIQP